MINDPDFRKNLLVSIVTSVLVLIFVEPILKWSANGLMWMGENISASFTKAVYSSAALGLREKYSFITLLFIIAMLAGAATGVVAASLQSTKINSPTSSGRSGRKKIVNIFVAATMILSGLYSVASNFIEMQLNASFSQRLTVLAANIPEQQVKDLKASWALMSSRSDYEAITAEMNRLAAVAKVKLPAALWD